MRITVDRKLMLVLSAALVLFTLSGASAAASWRWRNTTVT
jgi:hypothetical protein